MARPGFNELSWFGFDYDEAMLVSWLGQFPSSKVEFKDFHKHLDDFFIPAVNIFLELDKKKKKTIEKMRTIEGFTEAFEKLVNNRKIFKNLSISNETFSYFYCDQRLDYEIEFFKKNGIDTIICLTEDHHDAEKLKEHFSLHHFSTNDMQAPTMEHAHQLAEVIKKAEKDNEIIAVHCLAGIGRTSTILVAAHLLMGHQYDSLIAQVKKRNPHYLEVGSQKAFLHSIKDKVRTHF
ncbi:MAG: hypothetical protein HOO06_10135 [Bdellovibrionaceae bacterium]|jgi:hypothetical protein|nr:hypothetical protein [Pseudobdellovibrionaceae bacterium]